MLTVPDQGIHPGGRRARAARKAAERVGFHVVPRHFYSAIPDLSTVSARVWERESELRGIDFRPEAQLEFFESRLAAFLSEFRQQENGRLPRFDPQNDSYRSVDVEVLYAMVRHFKPDKLLELGSGWTTLVSAQAAHANAQDGHVTKITAVDPYPKEILLELERQDVSVEVRDAPAQELPLSEFTSLSAGDILFVDTTHTVKVGGEVNFIVLEVLPRLNPGVIVHFHDIFLPFEYPREWMERYCYFFNEQYLLQAFLAQNGCYEILLALYWLSRRHQDVVARVITSFGPTVEPSGFWLRRRLDA